MRSHTELELEVAKLIIDTLSIDSMAPEEIAPDDLLFGEGLGLDSIDALELALVVKQTYGLNIKSGDEKNAEIFSSLSALSQYISENKE